VKTWFIASIAVLSTACSGALAPVPGESSGDGVSANANDHPLQVRVDDAGAPAKRGDASGGTCATVNAGDASVPTCQCASIVIPPAPPPFDFLAPDANTSPPSECSLVGTWDVHSDVDGTNPATDASFLFDDRGHFFGGNFDQDVCATTFMYGSYGVLGDEFEILNGYGMGTCQPTMGAGYYIAFDATCTHATLTMYADGCTGGRHYLMDSTTTMTRRK
jgi:hypothetical protein